MCVQLANQPIHITIQAIMFSAFYNSGILRLLSPFVAHWMGCQFMERLIETHLWAIYSLHFTLLFSIWKETELPHNTQRENIHWGHQLGHESNQGPACCKITLATLSVHSGWNLPCIRTMQGVALVCDLWIGRILRQLNTAQRFIILWDRTLQLWIVIVAAILLWQSLGKQ